MGINTFFINIYNILQWTYMYKQIVWSGKKYPNIQYLFFFEKNLHCLTYNLHYITIHSLVVPITMTDKKKMLFVCTCCMYMVQKDGCM